MTARPREASIGLRFRLLVFLASFLLFQVELIFAKLVLPSFGSSASVWTTCLMFYQAVLFIGYVYASRVSPAIAAGRYRWVHLAVLTVPALAFPFRLLAPDLPPIAAIAVALVGSVGLPFLALSTTSIVAQGWFTRTDHPQRGDPYFLYGTSNAGALLALLTYPFVLEPALDMEAQLRLWYAGYALLVLLHAACVPPPPGPEEAARAELPPLAPPAAPIRAQRMLLSGGANALLVAVTNAVTIDASVPLLWIAPLTVFLATLVITFARNPPSPEAVARISLVSLLLTLPTLGLIAAKVQLQLAYIALHHLVLFVGCLLCHHNLVRQKPADTSHLGGYYLDISLGGWLGSALITVAVPLAFRDVGLPYLDYLFAAALILGAFLLRDRQALSEAFARPRVRWGAAAAVLGLGGLVALIVVASPDKLHGSRTFYGLYSVKDQDGLRWFHHGNTVHGVEALAPERRGEPLSYFHAGSPIGRLIQAGDAGQHVGVVGLGVGSLAAYAREGERWDLYELDPEVELIARRYFSYLELCRAQSRVILGDARLSLRKEPDASYDLLVLDAFSSDFLPTHLVTREAVQLYLAKLRPGGLLAFNISNRVFDMAPVLSRIAAELGLHGAWDGGIEPSAEELARGKFTSVWFVLAPTPERVDRLVAEQGWKRATLPAEVAARRVWSDGYVNLFHAVRR